MLIMPSVAMKGGSLARVMKVAERTPMTIAVPTPSNDATSGGYPDTIA
jgi:hypothetical protein